MNQRNSDFYVLTDVRLHDECIVSYVALNSFNSFVGFTSLPYRAILLSYDYAVFLRDLLSRDHKESFFEIVSFSDICRNE